MVNWINIEKASAKHYSYGTNRRNPFQQLNPKQYIYAYSHIFNYF